MRFFLYVVLIFITTQTFAQKFYTIADVKNEIVLGPLAGNRSITFGVKNILEEVIQNKGFDLGPNSTHQIQVTLYYFDVKKTSMQFAVYNRTEDETEIVAQAQLIVNGKPKKKVTARGTAKSVSTATLIIDEGGKFSQADISTAIKKVCEQLIKKLKLK
ncbi:YajG family lipoprotein [bacterium]|nr:YajG family lipoprotein [bacterium]